MSLRDLYRQYRDQVQFIMVYIREAHPVDGWWFGGGIVGEIMRRRYPKASMDTYDPTSFEERRGVAKQCEESLQYGIRTYVDDMDDTVSKAYAALPTRLYLIGLDGRVAYAGGLGPFGFSPTELGEAIEEYVKSQNAP